MSPVNGTCQCGSCYCPSGTRAATRVCGNCSKGDHRGLSRGKVRRIPVHVRTYGAPCIVCGAPVGRKCYKMTEDTIDGEPRKW